MNDSNLPSSRAVLGRAAWNKGKESRRITAGACVISCISFYGGFDMQQSRFLVIVSLVAISVSVIVDSTRAQSNDIAKLDERVAELRRAGKFREAIPFAQHSLEITRAKEGENDLGAASRMSSLAGLYREQGRYAEAEPLFKHSLAISEKLLGPEHPDVGTRLGNLAGLHQDQGRYTDAEPLFERSLAIAEKARGPTHSDVGVSLGNLASLYQDQGHYTNAEALAKRGLAILEKALGAEHRDVGLALHDLAWLYREQGRFADAEPLFERSLAIAEKAQGAEHPDVGTRLGSLAGLYQDQGRYAEVEPLYERALAITERALGPEHRNVGTLLGNLGWLYHDQGRYSDAESHYRRGLAIYERALGPEHPDVAFTLSGLADLHYAQNQYSDAEPLLRRSLAIQEKTLGAHHAGLAWPLSRLALIHQASGRNAEAERLINRAIALREKALGEKHPDVGMSLGMLAAIHEKQGRLKDAEDLYKRALAIEESALGTEHPNIATTRANLGGLYKSQGRYDEASALLASALAIRERTLPSDHPAIAASLLHIAELYRLKGQIEDAQKLFKRAIGIQKAGIKEILVFFGTDRNRDAKAKSITFGNQRDAKGQVTLGVAKVAVLKEQASHRARPAPGEREASENPNVTRLQIQPLEILEGPALIKEAQALLQNSRVFGQRSAMVFVHGYSVTFENAMRRAAQIAYDLNFDGPIFFFSWPSRARVWGYISDRDTVDVAAGHFKQFLEKVVAATQPAKVHFIAHSMGNLVLLRALEKMSGDSSASHLPIGEIISAAPDVDRDLFTDFVQTTKAKGAKVTVYASGGDWALWLSSKLSRPRAGYIVGELVPIKGAETIDITRAGTNLFALNHDVYASSPVIVTDMRGILHGERPPEKRTRQFQAMTSKAGDIYWRLRAPGDG